MCYLQILLYIKGVSFCRVVLTQINPVFHYIGRFVLIMLFSGNTLLRLEKNFVSVIKLIQYSVTSQTYKFHPQIRTIIYSSTRKINQTNSCSYHRSCTAHWSRGGYRSFVSTIAFKSNKRIHRSTERFMIN